MTVTVTARTALCEAFQRMLASESGLGKPQQLGCVRREGALVGRLLLDSAGWPNLYVVLSEDPRDADVRLGRTAPVRCLFPVSGGLPALLKVNCK